MRDERGSAQSVIEWRPFTRLIESKWAGRGGHILSLSSVALILRRRSVQTRRPSHFATHSAATSTDTVATVQNVIRKLICPHR